jgi:four helix bundle protein
MNYRASCGARSHAEFTSRISVVAEEADESAEWLDLIADAGLVGSTELPRLRKESRELLAIFSTSVGTARRNERSR